MFPTEKVKWLSMLHAGWPGGLVLGGLLTMGLANQDWKLRVALILLPTLFYGIFMLGKKFPVQERVSAGVSYRDMLREFGFMGAFLCSFLVITEITRVFAAGSAGNPSLPYLVGLIGGAVVAVIFGGLTGFSPGRPLFLFLMLVMIPLATTELGVDSWVSDLMTPVMGANAGLVLVYTSFIMMVLRFSAGGIVHRLSPIGLLAISAATAMVGLFVLSSAAG